MSAVPLERFQCIGIPSEDDEALRVSMLTISPLMKRERLPGGGEVTLWMDGSGAGFRMLNDGRHLCGVPCFDGLSRVRVIPRQWSGEVDCPWCRHLVVDLLRADGEPLKPVAIHLMDMGPAAMGIRMGEPAEAVLVAFAYDYRTFPDAAAFAAQKELPADRRFGWAGRVPAKSLISVWVSHGRPKGPEWADTEGILTGTILKSERRTNRLTRRGFVWALVETEGATVDVVATDDEHALSLNPGSLFHGACSLMGRMVVDGGQ